MPGTCKNRPIWPHWSRLTYLHTTIGTSKGQLLRFVKKFKEFIRPRVSSPSPPFIQFNWLVNDVLLVWRLTATNGQEKERNKAVFAKKNGRWCWELKKTSKIDIGDAAAGLFFGLTFASSKRCEEFCSTNFVLKFVFEGGWHMSFDL